MALAGCATIDQLPPGQRIAVWCNPVSHALDIVLAVLPMTSPRADDDWPGAHCVQAIKDQVSAAEEGDRHE